MRTKDNLSFEISSPTAPLFLRIIEVAAAGLLRDFGLDEEEGKRIAGALCRHLPGSHGGEGNEPRIHCLLRRGGAEGTLELRCDPDCDLRGTAEALNREFAGSPAVAGMEASKEGRRLVIKLKLPEIDQ